MISAFKVYFMKFLSFDLSDILLQTHICKHRQIRDTPKNHSKQAKQSFAIKAQCMRGHYCQLTIPLFALVIVMVLFVADSTNDTAIDWFDCLPSFLRCGLRPITTCWSDEGNILKRLSQFWHEHEACGCGWLTRDESHVQFAEKMSIAGKGSWI